MKIGIDIGGTNLAGGVVDSTGRIVLDATCPTVPEQGYDAVLGRIAGLVVELKEQAEIHFPDDPVDAVGCGVPGPCKDGIVIRAVNLHWTNVPLAQDLEALTGLPVTLINDATAAAVAENRFGATKGKKSSVAYTLGTGVGGGLIINGQVVGGAHGVASEFGHILDEPNFYSCNCGKNGCLETYSSATGLVKNFKHLVEEHGLKTNVDLNSVTAKDIIDAAKAGGDEAAEAAFEIMTDKLAKNIANMVDIIDPEIFVVGGGVANAGDFLFDSLKKKAGDLITFKEIVGESEIVPAKFGNDAGIIGAAYSGEYL